MVHILLILIMQKADILKAIKTLSLGKRKYEEIKSNKLRDQKSYSFNKYQLANNKSFNSIQHKTLSAQEYCRMGIEMQLGGKLKEAERFYLEAIALKPDYAQAFNNLGVIMSENDLQNMSKRMEITLSNFQSEISGLRAGRASINMVDNIIVDAYSSKMPLNQLSNISVPEPRLITVNVWDSQLVDSVVKSISGTDLGLNPQVEGTMIRLPIPELSEERRKEMVKVVGKFAESSKVAVRNIRRDTIEIIRKNEKSGVISQDQKHMFETQIQKITDEFIVKIDDIFSKKEKDIITV